LNFKCFVVVDLIILVEFASDINIDGSSTSDDDDDDDANDDDVVDEC
jgi:hypothetical protein